MWRRNLIPILLPIATSCSHHCRHRSHLRNCRHSQLCQHSAFFSSALLTVSRPVLKALAQTTVPVRKVLLTPAGVAPIAAIALLLVVGSSGFFALFRAPAVSSAVTFLSAIEVVIIEFVVGSPVVPLPAMRRHGALRCRQCLRVLLLPEKSVILIRTTRSISALLRPVGLFSSMRHSISKPEDRPGTR